MPTKSKKKVKRTVKKPPPKVCRGCIEDQPNQIAHMGGCLPNWWDPE